jgi:hypothetical protein
VPLKKTVYTLSVNNAYAPDITAMTFPLMKRYAEKIGAEFFVLSERKFPELPPACEKFQLYELAKEHGNDWNIFFDADTLIHPDMWDVTSVLPKNVTCSNGTDFVPHRFRPDEHFMRDGRMIGKGNWCAIVSDWCLDYWRPLDDISIEEATSNIFPTVEEVAIGITPRYLLDDYIVSRNIARFGLKHCLIPDLTNQYPKTRTDLLFHQYLCEEDKKEILMIDALHKWKVKI